ncbi:hypothetical protein IFM89_027839, partial [Coptis chinensis]
LHQVKRNPNDNGSNQIEKMSTAGELACSYACMLLHDDGIPITADKIAALVKAANVQVEAYWPGLFAKLVEKRNIEDLIMNVGSGGGGGAPVAVAASGGGGAPAAVAAPAAEEKKEEPKEESDEDMGFSLWPGLFAKFVQKMNIEDMIMNGSSGGGGAPVSIAESAGGDSSFAVAAPVAEEKKSQRRKVMTKIFWICFHKLGTSIPSSICDSTILQV